MVITKKQLLEQNILGNEQRGAVDSIKHGSYVVFEKEVISHSNNKVSAAHNVCNKDDRMSQHFHRFVILCICWDTLSENTCL